MDALKRFALALLVVCTSAFAAEDKQPQMSPDQKAMMQAWMKFMTPSEGHKMLDGMVGTWETKVTAYLAPGAPPMVSTGVSEISWILGGRYMGEDTAEDFGKRNAVPGELLARLRPQKVTSARDLAD